MNNPKVYTALSILGFSVSAVFTVIMFTSNSTGIIIWSTMLGGALLWECGKYVLLYQGIYGTFNYGVKVIMVASWFFVTIGSVFASSCQVLNDANENKNINFESSAAYQQQQDAINLKKDLYSTKKQEIENLRKVQEQTAQKGEEIKNSMPRNYIDRRQQQQDKTNKEVSSIQQQINSKSDELSNITKELATPLGEVKAETLDTTGAVAMFQLIAKKLNENPKQKKNPYSAEEVGIFFYILLGLGIEFLANLFAFLSQYYSNGGTFPSPFNPEKIKVPKSDNVITMSPTPQMIEGGRLKGMTYRIKKAPQDSVKSNLTNVIPMKSRNHIHVDKNHIHVDKNHIHVDVSPQDSVKSNLETCGYTEENVKDYIRVMNETKFPSGYSRGSAWIGVKIRVDAKTAEKIRGHLETIGVIQVVGNRTKIIKEVI